MLGLRPVRGLRRLRRLAAMRPILDHIASLRPVACITIRAEPDRWTISQSAQIAPWRACVACVWRPAYPSGLGGPTRPGAAQAAV